MAESNGTIRSDDLKALVHREFERILRERRELRAEVQRLESRPLRMADVLADLAASGSQPRPATAPA